MGVAVLLARLLAPEIFGLVAMLMVFMSIADALMDSGFASALIQRKNATLLDQSSVFFFNFVLSFVLAAALCFAAPYIASFYEQPELTALTRGLSLVLVINGFSVVQAALMTRRLDFKRQAVISTGSTLVSGVVALGMAWHGFGVWSLVGQQLSFSLTRGVLYWSLSPWRPGFLFSFRALREMFKFGSGMVASSILNAAFRNINTIVIGKFFSTQTLGYYNRAGVFESNIAQSLGIVANRVLFPVFSQLQDDPARLRTGLRKGVSTTAFLQFPLMIGLAAVAEPLMLALLTPKWARSIPYLQLMCFVGIWYPIHLLNLNALLGVGRSDIFFRLEMIKKLLIVINVSITAPFGVMAMIYGQTVNGVIAFASRLVHSNTSVPCGQLRELAPYAAISGVMGLMVTF
jgi:O-antigen/teichoic acid export membrane protein